MNISNDVSDIVGEGYLLLGKSLFERMYQRDEAPKSLL